MQVVGKLSWKIKLVSVVEILLEKLERFMRIWRAWLQVGKFK